MAKTKAPGARGSTARAPVEASNPDVELVQVDGQAVARWVQNAALFFTEAKALETQAHRALAVAQGMKAPTTVLDDEQLQDQIRSWKAGEKQIEGHWTITSLLHNLHKRAVAYRERGSGAYKKAIDIGNTLHVQFKNAETRRIEEERRRQDRENEERARLEREAELERYEQQALQAESASADLSEREQEFVRLVAYGFNSPVTSARSAGYKNPETIAPRLMAMPKIQVAIQALKDAQALRQQAEAVKKAPLLVEEAIVPDAPTGGDRTTWTGEVISEVAFRNAAFEGTHGIPRDCFTVDKVKLNEYARSMRENLNRWPGVRAKSTTRVV